MALVTYYMPKRFKGTIEVLANGIGIKIMKIKEEGTEIRIYCVGTQKLLDAFNELRLGMLGIVNE